jgi:hypothetical protein
MRVYVYLLDHDLGFAPNPFHGWCTLAGCKPQIRRTAREGDWIVGITARHGGRGNRVAYAMQVEERLSFPAYWRDKRFREKRPRYDEELPAVQRRGDNRRPPKPHDVSGKWVLIARRFSYFGSRPRKFPARLAKFATPAIYFRVRFTEPERAALLRFVEKLPQGLHAKPANWPDGDDSWRPSKNRHGSHDDRKWTEQPPESYDLVDKDGKRVPRSDLPRGSRGSSCA